MGSSLRWCNPLRSSGMFPRSTIFRALLLAALFMPALVMSFLSCSTKIMLETSQLLSLRTTRFPAPLQKSRESRSVFLFVINPSSHHHQEQLVEKITGIKREEESASIDIIPRKTPGRRELLFSVAAAVTTTAFLSLNEKNVAYALQERNEALCGTGFFTNIAQYKCTEIGDISDEGKSKAMNDDDLNTMNGLMEKFSSDLDIIDIGSSNGTGTLKKTENAKKTKNELGITGTNE